MGASIRGWATQALRAISEDWESQGESAGEDALVDLRILWELSRQLTISPQMRSDAESRLDLLMRRAHDQMARAHSRHEPTDSWRRLYTDACIFRCVADVLGNVDEQVLDEARSAIAIGRLDRAIIIAGPYGEGRFELIIEFISRLQAHTRWSTRGTKSCSTSSQSPAAPCAPLLPRSHVDVHLPKTFSSPIERINASAPPSLSAFTSVLFKKPFILSGYISDWPAMKDHPWSSLDYLRQVAGPARVVPVEVGSDYRAEGWTQTLMEWDEFLSSLSLSDQGSGPAQTDHRVLYLAQHDLFRQFPALRDDIILPDYVYTAPGPPESYPDYRPPANDDQLVVNAWLGPGGTVSPAHTDPFFNLYAQVVGRKTVWLSPPEVTPYMCSYGGVGMLASDTRPNSDDPAGTHVNPASNNIQPSMSNTSRVDVFSPDDTQFPLFSQHVVPHALCTILEPGDLLFFPPGWWHAMRSEDTSFSVSMWF